MRFPTQLALGIIVPISLLVLGCGGGESAEPTTLEGLAFVKQGKLESAIERFDQAIKIDPDFVPAYNNRGYVYNVLEQYQRAIEDYNEAIRLEPENAVAFNNRGFSQRNLGRYQGALDDFNEAIRLTPWYADAYAGRSLVNASLGNDAQADKDFEQAVDLGMDPEKLQIDLDRARREFSPIKLP